jgi:hypothetical protein
MDPPAPQPTVCSPHPRMDPGVAVAPAPSNTPAPVIRTSVPSDQRGRCIAPPPVIRGKLVPHEAANSAPLLRSLCGPVAPQLPGPSSPADRMNCAVSVELGQVGSRRLSFPISRELPPYFYVVATLAPFVTVSAPSGHSWCGFPEWDVAVTSQSALSTFSGQRQRDRPSGRSLCFRYMYRQPKRRAFRHWLSDRMDFVVISTRSCRPRRRRRRGSRRSRLHR